MLFASWISELCVYGERRGGGLYLHLMEVLAKDHWKRRRRRGGDRGSGTAWEEKLLPSALEENMRKGN